jgi:hypothetical protein
VPRRFAPHFELVAQVNGVISRRRIGSVPVVRAHLEGREVFWSPTADVLLDESQLDPLITQALPATSQADLDAARALQEHQHKFGYRDTGAAQPGEVVLTGKVSRTPFRLLVDGI